MNGSPSVIRHATCGRGFCQVITVIGKPTVWFQVYENVGAVDETHAIDHRTALVHSEAWDTVSLAMSAMTAYLNRK